MHRFTLSRFTFLLSLSGVSLGTLAVGCSAGSSAGAGSGGADGGATTGTTTGMATGTTTGAATGTTTGTTTGGGDPDPVDVTPGSYALPPPNQCKNQFYVEGCIEGDAGSACGGVCTSANACANEGKPGEPGFICPRFMLFADEMNQAAEDDTTRYSWPTTGDSPFNYAVVGHDTDTSPDSVDDAGKSPCCQCYQLVFSRPEQQVRDQTTMESTVPIPKPLVVQAFNTGATTKTFDIFMGAGGLGAFNACSPGGGGIDHQYSAYPSAGQPSGGGVKAVGEFGNGTACKNENNLVTEATLTSGGCQTLVETACNEITADSSAITETTRRSCIESNQLDSLYHQNWEVYAKRVACPVALTQVTGCKLVEDLPAPDPNVLTAAQAAADPSFKSGYSTTTMQDCCKPSCSWADKVIGEQEGGHTADGLYNSFYTCEKDGTPLTE